MDLGLWFWVCGLGFRGWDVGFTVGFGIQE